MSFSTLEILPNEILILIFQYSGDPPNILRTFLGLNQRFNAILLSRELHLLTDYLHLKPLSEYYESSVFQQVTRQFLSTGTNINAEKLVEILRPWIGYSIRQRFIEVTENFRLLREKFESVRRAFSPNELRQVDDEIKTKFKTLHDVRVIMEDYKRIEELVFIRGARLERGYYFERDWNLTSFVTKCYTLSLDIIDDERKVKLHWKLYSQIIQILLVSNPDLLHDRLYDRDSLNGIEHVLFFHFFGAQNSWKNRNHEAMNGQYNQAILDLLFLVFYYRSTTIGEKKTSPNRDD